MAKKSIHLKRVLYVWIVILMLLKINSFISEISKDPYKLPTLATKKHIVQTIYNDAGSEKFSVFIFNPTHFTPDYDYLLMLEEDRKTSQHLVKNNKGDFTYLIIPWTTKDLREDFIDNRTPNENFKTVKSWHIADETTILKRQRYEGK